jgi:hypothetical protein
VSSGELFVDLRWGGESGFRAEFNAVPSEPGGERRLAGLAVGLNGTRYGLVADRVDLGFVHALVSPWFDSGFGWPEQFEGVATSLAIGGTRGGGFHRFSGRLENLRIDGAWSGTGVSGLTLDLALDGDAPVLRPSGAVELRLPLLYPDAIRLARVGGSLRLREGMVRLDGLMAEHPALTDRCSGPTVCLIWT